MENNIANLRPKEWNIRDYVDMIFRRLWIILISFTIVFGGVVVFNFTRPPVYNSSSSFVIESKEVGFGLEVDPNLTKTTRPFGFYQALLQSATYRGRVIRAVKEDSILIGQGGIDSKTVRDILKNNLSLLNDEYSELITLIVEAYDPIVAYRIAVISTDALKVRCQEIEQEESYNVVTFVNNQVELAKKNLEDTEKELQEFKEKTKLNTIQEDGGIIKRLAELENQLTDVETQRKLAQTNLQSYNQRLEQLKQPEALELSDVESPEINVLRQEISILLNEKDDLIDRGGSTSQVAALERQIEAKKAELVQTYLATIKTQDIYNGDGQQSLRDVFTQRRIEEELNLYMLQNREQFYRRLINNYRKQHPNMLEHTIELARLSRAKMVYESLYNYLIQKGEEAKIQAATGTGGIRIIDPPSIPTRPIPQKIAKNLMLGFILGLAFGFGLALVRDYMDNSIQNPDDVQRLIGIPLVGSVPIIRSTNGGHQNIKGLTNIKEFLKKSSSNDNENNGPYYGLISSIRSRDPVVDTYRNLRTNLQFVKVDKPIKRLLVTSSIPGEGKTLTTANLAISFAELGERVMIVDCDLRKSMQHKLFNINKSPGLTDYLAKNIQLEEIVVKTHVPNLSLIPAGTAPPNPAEMLASQKMTDFIQELDESYDFIVYDSPPLISVPDPVLLSLKTENVLLIVRFAKTNWRMAVDGLKRLSNVSSHVIGAVLNGIKFTKGYGYYQYNYYYYYSDSGDKKRRSKKK